MDSFCPTFWYVSCPLRFEVRSLRIWYLRLKPIRRFCPCIIVLLIEEWRLLYRRDSPSIKKKKTQTYQKGRHNEADTCSFSLSRRDTSGPPRSSLETATEPTFTISKIDKISKILNPNFFFSNEHFHLTSWPGHSILERSWLGWSRKRSISSLSWSQPRVLYFMLMSYPSRGFLPSLLTSSSSFFTPENNLFVLTPDKAQTADSAHLSHICEFVIQKSLFPAI